MEPTNIRSEKATYTYGDLNRGDKFTRHMDGDTLMKIAAYTEHSRIFNAVDMETGEASFVPDREVITLKSGEALVKLGDMPVGSFCVFNSTLWKKVDETDTSCLMQRFGGEASFDSTNSAVPVTCITVEMAASAGVSL